MNEQGCKCAYMYNQPSGNSRWSHTNPFVLLVYVWVGKISSLLDIVLCVCVCSVYMGSQKEEKGEREAVVCCSLLFQCDNTEFFDTPDKNDDMGERVAFMC